MIVLQSPRDIVSPREGKRHDSMAPHAIGSAEHEAELQEVKDVTARTELGSWPEEFLAKQTQYAIDGKPPELLVNKLRLHSMKPQRLALAVSMDKPWHLGEFLLDELLALGVTYKKDHPHIQFCDEEDSYTAAMMVIMTTVHKALNRIFDIKYFWRLPRPEDFAGTPGCIFTVDNLGAPGHWSYGAGHAAAAAAIYKCLCRLLNLSEDLKRLVLDACWKFASGRTLLGVHFEQDNLEGFRVGLQF